MTPHEDVTASVAARIQSIMASAEREATGLQREVEDAAARQAAETRLAADEAAEAYLADARRKVDAFAQARIRRIGELTDGIMRRAEEIEAQLGSAAEARGRLDALVRALGETAAAVAREARAASHDAPDGADALGARAAADAPPEDAT